MGCGAGRFTEIAASTNAMVISLDYSSAVDANYASHGNRDNVLIVQGDIYRMPFKRGFFERIFCLGVLQHTPDVKKAFFSLPPFLKPGGRLAIDVYRYRWWKKIVWTRYWIRPLTKRMPVRTLYKFCDRYVRFMWPLCRLIRRLPGGRIFNRLLVIADHGGDLPLSDDQLKEWAILDTFDWLAPAFDQPQSLETVHSWFRAAGLADVDVRPGYNGIEGRGSGAVLAALERGKLESTTEIPNRLSGPEISGLPGPASRLSALGHLLPLAILPAQRQLSGV